MEIATINTFLHRKIKDGKKYNKFFSKKPCETIFLTKGTTSQGLEQMYLFVKKYKYQTKKLAEVLKGEKLEETVSNFYNFLHDHLQYSADSYNQNLKSPKCAWQTRKTGIDCKSYSLFASCLLSNLNIPHGFRKIKQFSAPERWSHVYVYIPNKGRELVIDATAHHNTEVHYLEKEDFAVVSDVFGMNASTGANVSNGNVKKANGGGNIWGELLGSVSPLIKYFAADLVKSLMSCDGYEYQQAVVNLKIEKELTEPLNERIKALSLAMNTGVKSRIQHLFNELLKEVDLGYEHLKNEAAFYAGVKCDGEVLAKSLSFVTKLKKVIDDLFASFLKSTPYKVDVFDKEGRTDERTLYFVVGISKNTISTKYRQIKIRSEAKYGVNPIFPFQKSSYKWLRENKKYLSAEYDSKVAVNWEREVKPLLNKVVALRERIYFGGEVLYYLEQKYHEQMERLWVKFDPRYSLYELEEINKVIHSNKQRIKNYEIKYENEIKADNKAVIRKNVKNVLALGIASYLILKT